MKVIRSNINSSKRNAAFSCLLIFLLVTCNTFAAEKTIGVIMSGDTPYYAEVHNAFMARLSKKGYSEKVEILVQKPYPDPISLSNAARKFIALNVDIVVTYGAPATDAAISEKSGIPIVYTSMYEPCKLTGFRNVTGVCSKALVSSLLRYLKALITISNLGVIYNSNEEDSLYQMQELNRLSDQYGFKVEEINLKIPRDVKQKLSAKRVDALFIASSSTTGMAFPSIIEFSTEQKIPTVSFLSDKNHYATITLSPAPKEQGEKAAEKVISILEGVPPNKIKVDISSETDLVFNLKEAKTIGFKIPMELVTEATKLIQ